jgi:hypothetical protein
MTITPRLPHPHLEHRSFRAPHVEHHAMDHYAIADVRKKDRHEPKKGGQTRKRSVNVDDDFEEDDDDRW